MLDELVRHYEDRVLSLDELFGFVCERFDKIDSARLRVVLEEHPSWIPTFRAHLRGVEQGAELVRGGQARVPSLAAQEAAREWRQAEIRGRTTAPFDAAHGEIPVGTEVAILARVDETHWEVEVTVGDRQGESRFVYEVLTASAFTLVEPAMPAMPAPIDGGPAMVDIALHVRRENTEGSHALPRSIAA